MVPAQFTVAPSSEREGWPCTVDTPQFRIGGAEDCPKTVQIDFNAPRNSRFGDRANCNVAVYAKPDGAADSVLIGGVTVQTYVPRPCRIIGQIVDPAGRPLGGVRLTFRKTLPAGLLPASWERERSKKTDRDGVFDLDVLPDAHQTLQASLRGVGDFTIAVVPHCGVGTIRLELSKDGLRLLR